MQAENYGRDCSHPDDIAARLCAAGDDLSRLALEGSALEKYKNEHITKAELRRLGF